jgi:TetR/AcrR family transcriptional repressor of nem operon
MPKNTERDTRTEILDLARELAQTRGFNWLSYQDLSDRLEIRKASIHYHFPTKADLGAELLREYRKVFATWSEKVKSRTEDPIERLDAYFDMFRKIFGDSQRVCAGGVFSLEWHTLPKAMKEETKALFDDHRKFLETVLKAGRKVGAIKNTGTLEEQTQMINAGLQGALQLARVQNAPAPLQAVAKQLRSMLVGRS